MTNAARLLQALSAASAPDDCLSVRAGVFPRQQVFQIATRLACKGKIARVVGLPCTYCGAAKKASALVDISISSDASALRMRGPHVVQTVAVRSSNAAPAGTIDTSRAWHWEGNVQTMLRRYLEASGWIITASANTETKEPGIDLAAAKDNRELMVEVKSSYQNLRDRRASRAEHGPSPRKS